MKNALPTLLLAALLTASSCGTKPQEKTAEPVNTPTDSITQVPDGYNASNALDVNGEYLNKNGNSETSITLQGDNEFILRTLVNGKKTNNAEEKGTYTWNAEGNTISLQTAEGKQLSYFVEETALVPLDAKGQKPDGTEKEKLSLKKTNTAENTTVEVEDSKPKAKPAKTSSALYETKWILKQLNGKEVKLSKGQKELPYLILKKEKSQITGYGGCNTLGGTYVESAGNRISFEKMVSTKMACINDNVEYEFLKALNGIDNYGISGQNLSMSKARMAPALVFESNEK